MSARRRQFKATPMFVLSKRANMNMATWTVVGISLGAAMGSATDNMGGWLSCGAALGLVIGAAGTRGKP
jgi:hypothetical protein